MEIYLKTHLYLLTTSTAIWLLGCSGSKSEHKRKVICNKTINISDNLTIDVGHIEKREWGYETTSGGSEYSHHTYTLECSCCEGTATTSNTLFPEGKYDASDYRGFALGQYCDVLFTKDGIKGRVSTVRDVETWDVTVTIYDHLNTPLTRRQKLDCYEAEPISNVRKSSFCFTCG